MNRPSLSASLSLIVFAALAPAQEPAVPAVPSVAKPAPNSADEPKRAKPSLAKAAEFLDAVNLHWNHQKKCGTCHTNYPYLMARPALKEVPLEQHNEVRRFFEQRIAGWDTEKGKPRWDAEVIATACALAVNDARTTGKLHPLTRQALDRMWTLQLKNGSWDWLKCAWPPFEHDDYFGAVFVATCVGQAPDNYAATETAAEGLAKLRVYLKKTSPPNVHHKAWLLWAACNLDDVMTPQRKAGAIEELLALQRPDGGWSLPTLGYWEAFDPKHLPEKEPASDGYATGFVVYVLRQGGLPADHAALRKGVRWLHGNQRESGRWFTRSLNTPKFHYMTHAGTAFAALALKACE